MILLDSTLLRKLCFEEIHTTSGTDAHQNNAARHLWSDGRNFALLFC